MNKKIGILGSGVVGLTLAKGFRNLGYDISIGNRDGHAIDVWNGTVGTFTDVAERADIVVLAVKGLVAESVVTSVQPQLAGKTVIDTTNPLSDDPPTDGVVHYFTTLENSLMERLQATAPDAHFVKAFNSVGSAYMVNPQFTDGKPTMFICGNDKGAKAEVTSILNQFGWDVADMGNVTAARAIEPLCMLWCIPGFLRNDWTHAFKLLTK